MAVDVDSYAFWTARDADSGSWVTRMLCHGEEYESGPYDTEREAYEAQYDHMCDFLAWLISHGQCAVIDPPPDQRDLCVRMYVRIGLAMDRAGLEFIARDPKTVIRAAEHACEIWGVAACNLIQWLLDS